MSVLHASSGSVSISGSTAWCVSFSCASTGVNRAPKISATVGRARASFGAAWCRLCLSFHQATLKPCFEAVVSQESYGAVLPSFAPGKSCQRIGQPRCSACGRRTPDGAGNHAPASRTAGEMMRACVRCEGAAASMAAPCACLLPEERLGGGTSVRQRQVRGWPSARPHHQEGGGEHAREGVTRIQQREGQRADCQVAGALRVGRAPRQALRLLRGQAHSGRTLNA